MQITEKQFLKRFPGHDVYYNDLRINQDHFKTSDSFWDCSCPDEAGKCKYIHNKKDELECNKCGAREEDMPDSRVNEIIFHQEHINLTT